MKRSILIIFSVIFLFSNVKSFGQTPAIIDNFKPGVYNDLGPLTDQNSPLYQELKREKYNRFGNSALSKRDNYLNRINSLKARSGIPMMAADYPYMAGMQYFGIIGGFGMNTFYSKRINKDWRVNFHLGFLSLSNRYMYNRFMNDRFNTDIDFSVLILPSYLGFQRFISSKYIPKRMNVHVEGGVGPIMGMDIPRGYGFFGTFSNALYRVTPGGFVGGGINVRINNNLSAFADLKYHVIVFSGRLGYTNNFSTPSIYFGISRGFSLFR